MSHLISIIIPTYNRADLIEETLNSVVAQTYSNWECIIVDDGSTDNSADIIQKYVDSNYNFRYYSRPVDKKKGPSSCRNFGIKKSEGNYIIFLDSDDLLSPDCIEERILFSLKNPEYDFWIFNMQTFGYKQAPLFNYGYGHYENENEYCRDQFAEGNHPFVVTCPLWKKSTLESVEGFNENLTMFEDPELHLRILKNNFRLHFANFKKADSFYRLKNEKPIINGKKIADNLYVFFENHLEKQDLKSILYYKKSINEIILKKTLVFQYFKFCKLGVQRNIISDKNIFHGIILLIYHTFVLYKLKGIGYNYFKTGFNKF